jgi:hypothetical protein
MSANDTDVCYYYVISAREHGYRVLSVHAALGAAQTAHAVEYRQHESACACHGPLIVSARAPVTVGTSLADARGNFVLPQPPRRPAQVIL